MKLLVVNGTYTTIELALVNNHTIVAQTSFAHIHASTQLLPAIQELCTRTETKLSHLTAIGANVGPGPFTTMRSIIATINGVAYATQLPLLALNGMTAFARAHQLAGYTHTVILLNAFCNDVYYAQYDYATGAIQSGCISIQRWVELQQQFLQKYPYARVAYAGNGCVVYRHELAAAFGMHALPLDAPEVPALQAIIAAAYRAWEQHEVVQQLAPLYLKAYAPHK